MNAHRQAGCHACSHQYLKVVLFAKGRGDAPSTYRPNKDASQWWNRRDALVRCVASFLFGPSVSSNDQAPSGRRRRELVILFDEDWSRIHMTYDDDDHHHHEQQQQASFVPTEKNILLLWKRCSEKTGATIRDEENGLLSARMETARTMMVSGGGGSKPAADANTNSKKSLLLPAPTSMESKREILEFLQGTCSMEFLREHRLNSPLQLLLRKTNKKALLVVLREWNSKTKQQRMPERTSTSKGNKSKNLADDDQQYHEQLLEMVLRDIILQQPQGIRGNGGESTPWKNLIVGTLHESSANELPCWDMLDGYSPVQSSALSSDARTQVVCLFLGAVRDMSEMEPTCLLRACRRISSTFPESSNIPILKIRLGPVAEFTSKILSVVAFHHANDKLFPALLLQLERQYQQQNLEDEHIRTECNHDPPADADDGKLSGIKTMSAAAAAAAAAPTIREPPLLHFVCFVPLASDQLSTELERRNRILWCLVRCVVVALWRSRVFALTAAGTTNSSSPETEAETPTTASALAEQEGAADPLHNRLSLVFSDGATLTLDQRDVVVSMAEQHQAAPTEYQVLNLIKTKLARNFASKRLFDSTTGSSEQGSCMLDLFSVQEARPPSIVLNIVPDGIDLTRQVYSLKKDDTLTTEGDGGESREYVMVLFRIGTVGGKSANLSTASNRAGASSQHQISVLLLALRQREVPDLSVSLVDDESCCQDREAATITILQHFSYQGRLFPAAFAIWSGRQREVTPSRRPHGKRDHGAAAAATGNNDADAKKKEHKKKKKKKRKHATEC